MKSDKPQSLAVSYAVKRKGRKYAQGGEAKKDDLDKFMDRQANKPKIKGVHESVMPNNEKYKGTSVAGSYHPGEKRGFGSNQETSKRLHKEVLKEMYAMKKPNLYAEGGDVVEHDEDMMYADGGPTGAKPKEPEASPPPKPVSSLDDFQEELRKHGFQAEGGEIHEHDMVDSIMSKRDNMYSEGGKVANTSGMGSKLSQMADSQSDNFDDLSLRDDLEFHYTGDNSGDHLGDEQEDHDRRDIVSQVMASRHKKDKLPRIR